MEWWLVITRKVMGQYNRIVLCNVMGGYYRMVLRHYT